MTKKIKLTGDEPEITQCPSAFTDPRSRFYNDPSWLAGYWKGIAETYRLLWIQEHKTVQRLKRRRSKR